MLVGSCNSVAVYFYSIEMQPQSGQFFPFFKRETWSIDFYRIQLVFTYCWLIQKFWNTVYTLLDKPKEIDLWLLVAELWPTVTQIIGFAEICSLPQRSIVKSGIFLNSFGNLSLFFIFNNIPEKCQGNWRSPDHCFSLYYIFFWAILLKVELYLFYK